MVSDVIYKMALYNRLERVLILVLMEYGLGLIKKASQMISNAVS